MEKKKLETTMKEILSENSTLKIKEKKSAL